MNLSTILHYLLQPSSVGNTWGWVCGPSQSDKLFSVSHVIFCRWSFLLLTILHVGVQGSSPELLSVNQYISVLQSCLFSKHFVQRTCFTDVFFLAIHFRWLSILSSHLSLGLPLGLFQSIFSCIATLIDSSSDMVKPSKFVLIDFLNNGQHITMSVCLHFSFCLIW